MMLLAGGTMKKTWLWAVCLVALLGVAMPSQAFEACLRGDYWFPELSGDLRVDAEGITGTSLDLESDLGLDDESYPVVGAFVGLGNHHLRGRYYNADYSGTRILTEDITFNGETYAADERITSSLEYDVYDFMYQYDLLDFENVLAGFTLGIVGRVEVFDGDVEIRSETVDKVERESFTAAVPMVGLSLHIGLLADWLEGRVLATGMSYSDGTLFDGQAEVSFTPFPFMDIHGGYRFLAMDVDVDDVEFNYDNVGPYVALTLGF